MSNKPHFTATLVDAKPAVQQTWKSEIFVQNNCTNLPSLRSG